jgi:predicted RNA-binding protein with PIN domain
MHYIVDGYNMLFQSSWMRQSDSLEEARYKLLHELDSYANLLPISITLVFDAPQRSEYLRRSHYKSLELLFSSYGQTADDVIIDLLGGSRKGGGFFVVTSDKGLARRAQGSGAKTLGVKEFILQLRKRALKKATPKAVIIKEAPKKASSKKETELPPLSDLARWEKIFQDQLEKLS